MIKSLFCLLIMFVFTVPAIAQHERLDAIEDSIVNEGKALYRSEWASWYGTDIVLEKCAAKKALLGGYFSYETHDNLINIFYSQDKSPLVLASVTFNKDFNVQNYKLDTIPRKLTTTELDYYSIRLAAAIQMEHDTIFKYYKNSNLNLIPIIQKGEKKVYALSGPKDNGVLIFGNDYLLRFNIANELTSIKKLHKNIIPIYTKSDSGKTASSTMHTHLKESGDFMSATDICTLLLYERFTSWQTHYVISKDYVSLWDCKKNMLIILTMEAWKKIGADQQTRHPEKE